MKGDGNREKGNAENQCQSELVADYNGDDDLIVILFCGIYRV